MIIIVNTSEITSFFVASTMMISTCSISIVVGGDHWKVPVFFVCSTMSVMMTVISVAPAGTR